MVELLEDYSQILDEIGQVFVEEFDAPISQVLTANINEDGVVCGDLISGGNYYHYASDGSEIGLTFLPDETEEINDYARGFFSASYGLNLDSVDSPYEYAIGFYRQDAQVKCKKGGVPCGKICLPKGAVCRKFGGGGNAAAMKRVAGKLKSSGYNPAIRNAVRAGVAGVAAIGVGAGLATDPSIRKGAQVAAERVKRGVTAAGEEIGKGVEKAKESVQATAQRVEQQVKKGQYGKAAANVVSEAGEVSKIASGAGQNATNAFSKNFERAGKAVKRGVEGSGAAKQAKTVQKEVTKGTRKASRVAKVVGGRLQKGAAKAEEMYNQGEAAAKETKRWAGEIAKQAAKEEINKIKTTGEVADRVQRAGAKAEEIYNKGQEIAGNIRKQAGERAINAAKGEVKKAAKFIERQFTPKSAKKIVNKPKEVNKPVAIEISD